MKVSVIFFNFFSNIAGVLNLLNKTAAIFRGYKLDTSGRPKLPQIICGNTLSGGF
jgi:hypothetical protein